MKKKRLFQGLKPETPQYVVAHATWRASRGKAPSMGFGNIRNPKKALKTCHWAIEQGYNLVPDWTVRFRELENPHIGMKVRIYRLGEITGMLVSDHHLTVRKQGVTGEILNCVPGHGGDVWFVRHGKSEEIGAYCLDEMQRHELGY